MTVQDLYRVDEQNKPIRYCRVLLKLLQLRSKSINKTSGMLELELWKNTAITHPKMLRAIRFYRMSAILQSVHLVPDDRKRYYVNNYVDWDMYNTIYDDSFFEDGTRRVMQYKKSY